jgi:hypothetical protein
MRVIFEKEFAPLLTPKERRTSLGMIRTKARLRDPTQGSDRLVELCSEISMTVLVLAGAAKILVPLLQKPSHSKAARAVVKGVLRECKHVKTSPSQIT